MNSNEYHKYFKYLLNNHTTPFEMVNIQNTLYDLSEAEYNFDEDEVIKYITHNDNLKHMNNYDFELIEADLLEDGLIK